MTPTAEKLLGIAACPQCRQPGIAAGPDGLGCPACGARFERGLHDTPVLLRTDSPVRAWFRPAEPRPVPRGFNAVARTWLESRRPEERVWTRASQRALDATLAQARPAEPGRCAVLIGSGQEPPYRVALAAHPGVVRLGLAQDGRVDAYADLCALPLRDASVDLVLSSSVLEHVYDVEAAVAEMARVIRPGGEVYAEIPFMRAFHMIPVDYQRYTPSGIEALFARHGFSRVDSGVCSGPFTAHALYTRDFFTALTGRFRKLQILVDTALSWGLHPLKYLDRLCEGASWEAVTACALYYRGRRNGPAAPAA